MTQRMPSCSSCGQRHRGVAIITALLTVALVAALAVAAFWSQWRSIEMESAQRQHLQDDWLLGGALDWARSRLHDDGLSQGAVDHLGESWAQAVRDAPLAGFLAGREGAAATAGGDLPALFLSVSITDAQARLNVTNLLEGQALSPPWLAVFGRLFAQLGLPAEQLSTLAENLRAARAGWQVEPAAPETPPVAPPQAAGAAPTATPSAPPTRPASTPTRSPAAPASTAPLWPQQMSQLVWLGLPPASVAALQAHVTLLPGRTPVNLNTASPEVLQAVLPGLSRAAANQLVARRASKPFASLSDTGLSNGLDEMLHSVNSGFFEMRAELRQQPGSTSGVAQHALLQRQRADVRALWLRRSSLAEATTAPAAPAAPAKPP